MQSIYLLEPGSYMKVRGATLRIEKNGTLIDEIPAQGLERLTLIGRCSMTGAVLDFLIENRVETVFITLTGRFRARLLLDAPGHVKLRQLQYKRLSDKKFSLCLASRIVQMKISSQQKLLLRRSYRKRIQALRNIAVQLRALSQKAASAKDIQTLRGIEGAAARAFYSGFGLLIQNENFFFNSRNKRPPLDPVNALLSFVYVLFTNEVLNAVKVSGLDPYLGALHEPVSGRPSLACDLVEEWRAMAENFVLNLINRRMVEPDDFVHTGRKERPIEMAPGFVRALISGYEKKMEQQISLKTGPIALRWAIHSRIQEFVEYLKDGERELPLLEYSF